MGQSIFTCEAIIPYSSSPFRMLIDTNTIQTDSLPQGKSNFWERTRSGKALLVAAICPRDHGGRKSVRIRTSSYHHIRTYKTIDYPLHYHSLFHQSVCKDTLSLCTCRTYSRSAWVFEPTQPPTPHSRDTSDHTLLHHAHPPSIYTHT